MIKVTCVKCGMKLEAPDEAAGKKGRCHGCGTVLDMPGSEAHEAKHGKQSTKTPVLITLIVLATGFAIWALYSKGSVGLGHFSAGSPGSISGGMWITKGGGQSDIIRGQAIFLLPEYVCLHKVKNFLQHSKTASQESVKKYEEELKTAEGDWEKAYQAALDANILALKMVALLMDSSSDFPTIELLASFETILAARFLTPACFLVMTQERKISLQETYFELGLEFLDDYLIETKTTIEGQYKFDDIPEGKYVIVSNWKSAFNYIEWIVPVAVKGGEKTELDIHNANAIRIKNI